MGFKTEIFVQQRVDENLCCHICFGVMDSPTTVCVDGQYLLFVVPENLGRDVFESQERFLSRLSREDDRG